MVNYTISSSAADRWAKPRQNLDPNMRRMVHGRVRPMEERGFFSRLLHWR